MLLKTVFTAAIAATGVLARPWLGQTRSVTSVSARAVSPGNTNTCSATDQSYLNNIICPAFKGTAQLDDFSADDVGEYFDQVLPLFQQLLGSSDPLGQLLALTFNGLLRGLTQGSAAYLKILSAVALNSDPDCRCNAELCTNDLYTARAECAVDPRVLGRARPACGDAIYVCSDMYTRDQINDLSGCCSLYTDDTDA